MYTLIIGVIIFASLLLVLTVLAQNPKGGGLSSQFGGAGASQVMGVKKTGDLLEKLTWGFSITILLLTLLSNLFIEENQTSLKALISRMHKVKHNFLILRNQLIRML